MKTKLLQLSIALATAFMFLACEKTQTPDNNPTNNDSINTSDNLEDQSGDGREPEMCLMLVKFTDDKYREHIIATKITSKTACMRSFRPPVVEELTDDTELVAVIMAAISAYESANGGSADGFVVRSIRRANRRN